MGNSRGLLWVVMAAFYLVFCVWYTNLDGPLRDSEIDEFVAILTANGAPPDRIATMRRFMEEDTGNQFIMINSLDVNENPPELPATGPNANASELLDHYMEHMYPAQFARASHPVFFGNVVFQAMDISGIEGAEVWDMGALFRYRSRRDIMAISTNPAFSERHDYKMAALVKTVAYPVEPSLYYADVRFMLLLILFSLASLIDLLIYRRR